MVEWSITPVLKTGVLRGTGGSNPSPSAKYEAGSFLTIQPRFVLASGSTLSLHR